MSFVRLCILLVLAHPLFAGQEAAKKPSASGEAKAYAVVVNETHLARVEGLALGMTAEDVLERLGRMPDKREDKDGEIVVYWGLPDNNIVQINFRNDRVRHLALQYRPPRPTSDFWFGNTSESGHYEVTDRNRAPSVVGSQDLPDTLTQDRPAGLATGDASNPIRSEAAPTLGRTQGADLQGRDVRVHPGYKEAETADHERMVWSREEKIEPGYRVEVQFLSTARQKMGGRYQTQVEYKYVSVAKKDLKKFDEAYRLRKD